MGTARGREKGTSNIILRVLAYCLMPNHFHLVLWRAQHGDLSTWMARLMNLHVRRYQRHYHSTGHIWQGRFKAFPIEQDQHLRLVLRYLERNPFAPPWSIGPRIGPGPASTPSPGGTPPPGSTPGPPRAAGAGSRRSIGSRMTPTSLGSAPASPAAPPSARRPKPITPPRRSASDPPSGPGVARPRAKPCPDLRVGPDPELGPAGVGFVPPRRAGRSAVGPTTLPNPPGSGMADPRFRGGLPPGDDPGRTIAPVLGP